MDQTLLTPAPYFDADALRAQLTSLWKEHSSQESTMRAKMLTLLKQVVDDACAAAERQLRADGNGRKCAQGLSCFQDEFIGVIYDYTVAHVYRAKNPSSAERMSVIATGGYGRGLLAPGSDIDLLFLLPYKQTAWGESVVESILYMLWDLGFKVGHATRTVRQSVKLAQADMTIRTSLLDARLILGDKALFDELLAGFQKQVVAGSAREFIAAKLEERDARHTRSGASRYLVEPNVKDGKGGLRDLHTLYWLARYLHPEKAIEEFVEAGVFSRAEYITFQRSEDFLLTVRCHLHFLTGRPDERLSFDLQSAMAERLGYREHRGQRPVERFMKHYFLVAKDVGDLTRIVCSALEVKQLTTAPALKALLAPMTWRKRARLRKTSDFKIDNGRINVAHGKVFKQDPVNLIRLFWLAEKYNVLFHPEAFRLVRASLKLIDKKLRANKEANELFVKLLTSPDNPEVALRRMNEAGVLGRFVPSFGTIVSMMQFNMYHHYTVDEHLVRSVGILSDIEHGRCADDHPVATEILPTLESRRALYVAAFVHDIAKGREEDHSIAGARIARRLCPRLGLSAAETETVSWLVEHHLDMSLFAQSRDLNDPKTIQDFAEIVQSPERLKLLLILTVADIRAVGPGVWNGWKGQLLRTLYYETRPVLAGSQMELSRREQTQLTIETLRGRVDDIPEEAFTRFAALHEPDYWLRTTTDQQVRHARMIVTADARGADFAADVMAHAFEGITELSIFSPSHPRLLSMIAGACTSSGANIVGAQISTTRDGHALDTIRLAREFDRSEDEERRAARIAASIQELVEEKVTIDDIMSKRPKSRESLKAFSVEPQVVIDNNLSEELTVIEINCIDRPGLLFDLTREIADLKLNIASAHIATFGEKAVDVFYVTGPGAAKVTNAARQTAIRHRLLKVLAESGGSEG
ncbi:bifunctional uridylyltransferase/uridylyl-removing enzyme [bacterium BMS3Bbin10]|nr:bifunctional uridylyltransferase/uridylyl-removing enzyme [bacterium BMS3Bbin10]